MTSSSTTIEVEKGGFRGVSAVDFTACDINSCLQTRFVVSFLARESLECLRVDARKRHLVPVPAQNLARRPIRREVSGQ